MDSSIVWRENFLLVAAGKQPADWTIAAEPKPACQVAGMPGAIDKVLKLSRLTGSGTLSAEKDFPPCSGFVSLEWRFFESEAGRDHQFSLLNEKKVPLLHLRIDSAGIFRIDDTAAAIQPPVVTNQWYKVTVLLFTDRDCYDLYINDIPVYSEVPCCTPATSVTGIRVECTGAAPAILHVTDFLVISRDSVPERTVRIHLDRERQRIDGIGFCHEGNRNRKDHYIIDELIQGMLDNKMSLFRDRFPGSVWEPANDNDDPLKTDMTRFAQDDSAVIATLVRLKEMQKRGIKTILGIWNVPDWMISNPEAGSAREIGNLDEFAESVCAFLRYGKQQYGLSVDYVDVNETEIVGIRIRLSADEYGSFIKKCGLLFKKYGLTTKVNIGSTLKWGEPYVAEMYRDPSVRTFGGYPAYHSYRGTGTEPNDNSTFINWGIFRQSIDRNIWCTETDYDAYLWENPERTQYRSVTEMAFNYWRVLYLARTSATAGWFWRPAYPSHEVHRAYMNFLQPGGKIVEATQDYPGLFTVAYKHARKKKFVLQVLNSSERGGPVTFTGVPDQSLTLVRTSEAGERFTTVGSFKPAKHQLVVDIEGESFNTLYGNLDP